MKNLTDAEKIELLTTQLEMALNCLTLCESQDRYYTSQDAGIGIANDIARTRRAIEELNHEQSQSDTQ